MKQASSANKGTVLFLSYYFPPLNSVACLRTWAIAKYLASSGWRMKVVTPRAGFWAEIDEEPLLERGAELVGRMGTDYYWPCLSQDTKASRQRTVCTRLWRAVGRRLQMKFGLEPTIGWYYAAKRALSSVEPRSVDLVLASGWPFSSFSLATCLARRLRCGFILDYRDLWTANPFAPFLNTRRNRRMESRVLEQCEAVVTTSAQSAEVMKRMVSPVKVHVVTNGYHPDRLGKIVPKAFGEKAIVYAGMLYPPFRTLDPLLRAMAEIPFSGSPSLLPFRLHYFGPDGRLLLQHASGIGVTPWVVDHGRVSQQEAMEAIAGAHVVVVVNTVGEEADEAERGVVPGKVFEALGLGKRVLVVAPRGSDVETVVGRNGRRFSGTQIREIASYLLEAATLATPPYEPPPTQYSWDRLAQVYDNLVTGVNARRHPHRAAS